jgi:hypothetical protein
MPDDASQFGRAFSKNREDDYKSRLADAEAKSKEKDAELRRVKTELETVLGLKDEWLRSSASWRRARRSSRLS